MEVKDQFQAPAALTPRKAPSPPVPTGEKVDEPENQSERCGVDKLPAPTENRIPALQPVVHLCTDRAILALQYAYIKITFTSFHVEQ
jgi:hypothetical protein